MTGYLHIPESAVVEAICAWRYDAEYAPFSWPDDANERLQAAFRSEASAVLHGLPVEPAEDGGVAELSDTLAKISAMVTGSYPAGMDAELVARRRLGKISVEAGELADAIEGWTGENPRKGVYATRGDVIKELLDCGSASLCAVEFMTGDAGESIAMLAAQVAGNWERLSAFVAAPIPVQEDRP